MQWTDERVELLKKLWADGLSASQIAAELGGVTRNAVIGKVHRLGLSGRAKAAPTAVARIRKPVASPTRPAASSGNGGASRPQQQAVYASRGNAALAAAPVMEARHVAAPAPRPVAMQLVETTPFACESVTIMELKENMCRWPLGDPSQAEFRFCGGRSTPGHAYCPHHATIAYQPANDRRRDRRPMMPSH
ncbi:GcrA cell cycle regulator [Methylopila capsulata]|uniref:GcrA cell cycle regulator n=1 Tax=Methylopila capsulata TaxID=61654 RepID=A0A9W6IV78_9HYPH|nr:GcrA family cell cycle regulator [Methylopila capsulata]MBM7853589.1 GcrA cell cycle regulator [Methylopila capsulata]GLK57196.1 hypothetical protein GCM10008170_32160 [Methylopila capsulata]